MDPIFFFSQDFPNGQPIPQRFAIMVAIFRLPSNGAIFHQQPAAWH